LSQLEEANQVCAQVAMLVAAEVRFVTTEYAHVVIARAFTQVRGVGTSLELKQKFAAGYTIEICANAESDVDNVCKFVFETVSRVCVCTHTPHVTAD
jgi:hypothetical protein